MRSKLEEFVTSVFPRWQYIEKLPVHQRMVLPNVSTYLPDFETSAHVIEVKAFCDKTDRAKITRISNLFKARQCIQIIAPEEINRGWLDITVNSAKACGYTVKVWLVPNKKYIVALGDEKLGVKSAKSSSGRQRDVLTGRQLADYFDRNGVDYTVFCESNIETLVEL